MYVTTNTLLDKLFNVFLCLPISSTPNFTLAPAIDVLTTGTYPRLPTCIRDRIVPLPPLTTDQSQEAFFLIDCAIRRRLLAERVPNNLKVKSVGKLHVYFNAMLFPPLHCKLSNTHTGQGVVTFEVPYEFELSLSVVGDDITLPWRLISLKILVGNSLPGLLTLNHNIPIWYLTFELCY